ncbi:TIGR02679 family protein [Alicyclobacillus vulcanalis]|uniref:TIGR02679 family protein n=1 Tax=Alicyclobacillus vulcanalis TaxID=252246 RepID=A0A1N7NYG2_9BACL|nr:TIGR02679 family protein [Alicyclobacillus vulcanalis]SIT03352.1 TIGR02679 family protein [Alicyclobacillus vulcanalis]
MSDAGALIRDALLKPALTRLWDAVRSKYESLGRARGNVILSDATPDEQEAIGALLGINLFGQTRIQVPLARLEAALLQSRFQLTLGEALAALFGEVVTREGARTERERTERAFRAYLAAIAGDHAPWLEAVCDGRAPGRSLVADWRKQFAEIGRVPHLEDVLRVLSALDPPPDPPVRLPILAARYLGDPHALDRTNPAGKMLFAWLAWRYGGMDADEPDSVDDADGPAQDEGTSETVRAFGLRAGIRLDDLSPVVHVANWPGTDERPMVFTLALLERAPLQQIPPRLLVVENPAVFAELAERARAPVVCSYGWPNAAVLRLFDAATSAGAVLWYSGDFDLGGLRIGRSLWQRYGRQWVPWRFDSAMYTSCVSFGRVPLSEGERSQLARLQGSLWDPELALRMQAGGVKVFQEQFVDALVQDAADVAAEPR